MAQITPGVYKADGVTYKVTGVKSGCVKLSYRLSDGTPKIIQMPPEDFAKIVNIDLEQGAAPSPGVEEPEEDMTETPKKKKDK